MVIPKVTIADLDSSAFRKFREKSLASERLQKADLEMSDEALLDSLLLIENGELTRAAVLLFHQNPEKYVFGAFVKVGYFENDADLIYQDEFHGALITLPDEIIETIYRKYFKGMISYEGLQRIEDFPVPRPALREAILNAIVHRDYTTGIPIQIKVFPDCVIVYNDGRLPENWTVADLLKRHRSRPYNPKIAYTFYRSGYIETWGRGIEKITSACKEARKPKPLFETTPGEVTVTFYIEKGDIIAENTQKTHRKHTENTQKTHRKRTENIQKILNLLTTDDNFSRAQMATQLNLTESQVIHYLKVMKNDNIICREGGAKGGKWKVIMPKQDEKMN
jgi:ATP-dependent DNA helicase RecG